jgi:hypothetical protein
MNEQPETGVSESLVDLPAAVAGEFEVYINGILQRPGSDYRIEGRTLVFPRPLAAEVKMSKSQWVKVAIGIGSYGKHDTVDITYQHVGRRLVATGLRPRPRDGNPDALTAEPATISRTS